MHAAALPCGAEHLGDGGFQPLRARPRPPALIASGDPERLNKEVKHRADVVGISPNEIFIIRLTGAMLLQANDQWQPQHRYTQIEPMAELMAPIINVEPT